MKMKGVVMDCLAGCGGSVPDLLVPIDIGLVRTIIMRSRICDKCGKLYWSDDNPVCTKQGDAIFRDKNGEIVIMNKNGMELSRL